MTTPNWYPDPSERWELRWWDGQGWAENVATGPVQSTDPYPSTPTAPTDPNQLLAMVEGTSGREPVQFLLSWETLTFVPQRRPHETRVFPLWMVTGLEVSGSTDAAGGGKIRLSVGGPGYVGPAVFVIDTSANAHWLRALTLRQRAITTGIPAAATH